jgi:hypothetical protein
MPTVIDGFSITAVTALRTKDTRGTAEAVTQNNRIKNSAL